MVFGQTNPTPFENISLQGHLIFDNLILQVTRNHYVLNASSLPKTIMRRTLSIESTSNNCMVERMSSHKVIFILPLTSAAWNNQQLNC